MIKIICGRAAEQVRKDLFHAVSENLTNGRKSYLLVPEQQVLAYEDEAIRNLPSSAPLNFTVTSFSLLSDIVLRKHGGLSFRTLSKPIKVLSMWNALHQVSPLLKAYRRSSFESLCQSMLVCTDELKSAGILPEHLEDAVQFLGDTPALQDKLSDISLIYSAYFSLLQNRYGDANDSLRILNETLKKHRFFEGADVFIDSFTDFTPIQYRIIEHMIRQAKNVVIAFPCDPETDSSFQFESVRRTFDDIKKSAQRYEKDVLTERSENTRNTDGPLSYLCKSLWDPTASRFSSTDISDIPIEIYKAKDLHDEVCACINLVRREIYRGRSFKDVVILSRNPKKYEKLLSASAAQSGIPLFTSDRQPLAGRSFVTYLTSLLRIMSGGWQRSDLLAHLKCGLSGISTDDVNRFELYVSRWNINGKAHFTGKEFSAPFKKLGDSASKDGDAFLDSANLIKNTLFPSILALEKELTSAPTIKDMLVSLCNYLEERKVYTELHELSERLYKINDRKGADQTSRIYKTVLDIFDDTAYCLQDEAACSVSELSSLLELLFSAADLGSIPTLQDEVILADASLYRSFGHKTAIVLGLCDGEFPRPTQSEGLITLTEKERLRAEGLPLLSDPCDDASKEYLHVWRAFSCAKERLICTYPATDAAGSPTRPSIVLARVSAIFGTLPCKNTEDVTEEILHDPLSMLMRLSLQKKNSALYDFICKYLEEKGVDSARAFSKEESLVKEHTLCDSTDAPKPDSISPSALEEYNKCAFSYFCSRILKLQSGEKNSFSPALAGTLIHMMIENYLKQTDKSLSPDELCMDAAMRCYEDTCPEHLRDSERLKMNFERTAINAALLARYVDMEMENTSFKPMAFEVDTHRTGGLKLECDPPTRVFGRIDRVDEADCNGEKFLRVIDYKSGKKKFTVDAMEKGIQLQLPLYLLSLVKGGASTGTVKKTAGGFLYLSSAITKKTVSHAADAANTDAVMTSLLLCIETSGIMNSLFVKKKNARLQAMTDEALDELLSKARSVSSESVSRMGKGVFSAKPQKNEKTYPCDYCAYAAICRKEKHDKTKGKF